MERSGEATSKISRYDRGSMLAQPRNGLGAKGITKLTTYYITLYGHIS